MAGVILRREELIVGRVDEFMRLFGLKAICEGFDESDDLLLVDFWLWFGGDKFVEGEGVVLCKLEGASCVLEVELWLREVGKVML